MCLSKLFKKKKEKTWEYVCNDSLLLVAAYCPGWHNAEYIKGQEPIEECNIPEHLVPLPPLPPPKPHIVDNPKPDWMPRTVAGVLRIHYDSVTLTDDQLKSFAEKLSLAGVDYVRIMGDWESNFTPGSGVSAFHRVVDNKFDLDQPNSAWDDALIRLRDLFKSYYIHLYFDLIDNCDGDKGPWAFNINGFSSIYDPGLVDRYIKFFDRVYAILGRDAKYGLGNEFGGDYQDWMRGCILPLAEYMYDKIEKPLCFSGYGITGHHLHGLLSPDVSTKFGIRDSCWVNHGSATPSQILSFLNDGSGVRCYAYSDDGVTAENLGEHGPCTPADVFCQGTIQQRINVVRAMDSRQHEANDHSRFDHIEFLPREISWDGDPNNITEESLKIYNDLSVALWGIDIRRRLEI